MKTRQQNLHLPRDFVLAKFKRDARERVVRRRNEAASGGRSRDWSVRRPARKPVGLSAGRRACLFASFLCTRVSRVSHKGVRRRRFHAT